MSVLDVSIPKTVWVHEVGERNGAGARNAGRADRQPVDDAGPWESAVRTIAGFQHLADDWDGAGAKAPPGELLASAIALAYLLNEKGLPPPDRVVPGLTGSVIIEWQGQDGSYTEIEIVRPFYAEVMMIEPGQAAKHWTLPTE
jgi:hypothetical protein